MPSDVRALLQQALAPALSLERELGGGGMSRVFLAVEPALARRIVVKVFDPSHAGGVDPVRFRREIQLLASLQHPHIVPIHSSGEVGGLPYYTMPYVEGESLRARLAREGELSIAEATRVLRDVADALAHAHRHGVTHRDIKPDNVLVADGHAWVSDFGIARAFGGAGNGAGEGTAALTATGIAVGTPAYMAPEQAVADPRVDHRADIYAFGALAYELLTGRPPFEGSSPQAVIAAHLTDPPVRITAHRASIPPPLARLVMRCLEKHPADRPQSADELLGELAAVSSLEPLPSPRRLTGVSQSVTSLQALALYAVAAAAVCLGAAAAAHLLGLPEWVLPGVVIAAALGLPVVLATALVQRHALARPASDRAPVSQRTSARLVAFAGPWLTWRRTTLGGAGVLGAFTLVVTGYMTMRVLGIGAPGSLLAAGVLDERDRVLVADFATPAADSTFGPAVTEAFRTDLGQSRVVTVVSGPAIRAALKRMERPHDTRLTPDVARELAMREGIKAVVEGEIAAVGASHIVTARLVAAADGAVLAAYRETAPSPDDIIPAIDDVSKRLRGKIGESLSMLRASPPLARVTTSSVDALRHYSQALIATEREGDISRGIRLLETAIRLDSTFAMAYRKLGIVFLNRHEQARAGEMLDLAFRHRHRLADAERYMTEGSYHSAVRNFDAQKAIGAYQALVELEPDHPWALNNLAIEHHHLRNYALAERLLRRGLAASPETDLHYRNLAALLVDLGRRAAADSLIAEAGRRFPDNAEVMEALGLAAFSRGAFDEAERHFREIARRYPSDLLVQADNARHLADVTLTRGRLAEAERLLQESAELHRRRGALGPSLGSGVGLSMLDALYRGAPERARAGLAAALTRTPLASIPVEEQPIPLLATAYAVAGEPARGEALLGRWLREGPHGLTSVYRSELALARGTIAEANGDLPGAIAHFRRTDAALCRICGLAELGRIFEQLREPDSAVAAYERYLGTSQYDRTSIDPLHRGRVHSRLAALYDARGDHVRATEQYRALVALWRSADPELQPTLEAARRRLSELERR